MRPLPLFSPYALKGDVKLEHIHHLLSYISTGVYGREHFRVYDIKKFPIS